MKPLALLGVALAAAALLVVGGASAATSSAATLPSAANAARYLSSLGFDPAGFVVQRGTHNYAGAKCPGKKWNCTTARRVLQIATGGGVNAVSCTATGGSGSHSGGATSSSVTCTIVQTSTTGSNTANCAEGSIGDTGTLTEDCSIQQTSTSGKNTATVVQGLQQGPLPCAPPYTDTDHQAQSGTQTATVIQSSTSGPASASVNQVIAQCVAAKTAPSVAQTQTTGQTFTIRQGYPGFDPGSPDCTRDTGTLDASASQSQHQRGYASGTATGTQSQHADLTGHVDQCSTGLAEYTAAQSEDQFLNPSPNVQQTQVGPAVLTGKPAPHGKRTLLRGVCCSFQGTNPGDQCTITQTTSQQANLGATQTENLAANAGTTGTCTGNVHATENTGSLTTTQTGSNVSTGLQCQAATCTGLQVPTNLAWSPAPSGTYHDPVTLAATLTRADNNAPVSGQTISFTAGAEACTATTDANGVASCAPTVTDKPGGSYSATATFAETSSYLGSSATTGFPVAKQPTALVYSGDLSADYHDAASLQVTLKEADTHNLVDAGTAGAVTLALGTQPCPAPVPVVGTTASCSISQITQTPGTVSVTASFDAAGNDYYLPSTSTTSFPITPEESAVTYTGPASADFADPVTLKGVLTEDGVTPLAGRSVTFALGPAGQHCSGTTNASGVASCTLTVNQASLSTTVSMSFAGDTWYAPSTSSAPFTITQEESSLSYTGATSGKKGTSVTVSAKLTHDSGISGQVLTFRIGTQSCTATTGPTGAASCTILLTQSPGAYTVSVTFAGNAYYRSNSASRSFTIKS